MSGVRLSVNNKRFKCSIKLVDKVTVIVGDSGSGKTVFANKLYQNFDDVEISDDYDVIILDTMMFKRWVKQAKMFSEGKTLEEYWSIKSNLPAVRSVIIVDDDDIVKSREFDTFFEKSQDSYFLFINRAKFGSIQYDIHAVYKMIQKGIEHTLVPVSQTAKDTRVNIDVVLIEDSGS